MAHSKLTTRLLEKLQPGELVRDVTVRGLFAQAASSGVVSLKIQADLRTGPRTGSARKPISIRMTLGQFPALGLDAARTEAMRLLAQIKAGVDPRPGAGAGAAPAAAWTVGKGYEAYIANLSKRPGSEASQQDMRARLDRYLSDWRDRPLASLTKADVEARQLKIRDDIKARAKSARTTGARAANATIRDLGAVWSYSEDYTPLGANPCRKVTMLGEVKAHHEIPMSELGAWWAAVGALKSPLRRAMHRLALLSGLRPGNVMGLRREWIQLEDRRIVFPALEMKGRRSFVLPLSAAMVEQVKAAMAAGDVLFPGSPWLFPGRGDDGQVQAVATVREPRVAALKDRTGHACRHTWKTCARNARLPESQIELLLAHRLGGQRDTYGSLAEQFDRLLEDQEKVSAYIMGRIASTPAVAAE